MKLAPFTTFLGKSYPAQSVFLDSSRTVNFYLEQLESQGEFALVPRPGKTLFATLPTVPHRGMLSAPDGLLYAVSGANLYRISGDGSTSDLGSVGDDAKPVSFAASDRDILIVSAGLGYYVRGGVLNQIASEGFPPNALMAGYSDGYFIVLAEDGYFYLSHLRDVTQWNALMRGTAESTANTQVSMIVDHRQVILMGNRFTQLFDDTGAEFPFEPSAAGTIQQGCAARFSPARLDNSIFWLGSDEHGYGMVWRLEGYAPRVVSKDAVAAAIQGYARIDDAVGLAYQWQGHSFYRLTFPTANKTWEYNVQVDDWQEVTYWNGSEEQADLGIHFAFVFNKHLFGSRASGKIYQLSGSTYTDDGQMIRRIRRAPHIGKNGNRVLHHAFQLDVEPGIGLVSGQGDDPAFTLRISNDGGKTFLPFERTVKVGKIGIYKRKAVTYALGSSAFRVYETVFTDPVPWRITGAKIAATECDN